MNAYLNTQASGFPNGLLNWACAWLASGLAGFCRRLGAHALAAACLALLGPGPHEAALAPALAAAAAGNGAEAGGHAGAYAGPFAVDLGALPCLYPDRPCSPHAAFTQVLRAKSGHSPSLIPPPPPPPSLGLYSFFDATKAIPVFLTRAPSRAPSFLPFETLSWAPG